MALDQRLLECAIEKLRLDVPNEVHITELYRYVESNADLTQHHLNEHVQLAGQIEPNWIHDLRNLLQNAKKKGIIINPKQSYWGISRGDLTSLDLERIYDAMVKNAAIFRRKRIKIENLRDGSHINIVDYNTTVITICKDDSNREYQLSFELVSSKISHLVNCGGSADLGILHRWSAIESSIIALCDQLNVEGKSIIFTG
jgi:hypothetical protein